MSDSGVHALVGDRAYPMDIKLTERLTNGEYPLVTFAIVDEDNLSCGRIEALVQIDAINRGLEKKTLWSVHRAVELATTPRLLQAAATASPVLAIRIAAFKLTNAEDDLFDEGTDTYRLRSQWRVLYVRT